MVSWSIPVRKKDRISEGSDEFLKSCLPEKRFLYAIAF